MNTRVNHLTSSGETYEQHYFKHPLKWLLNIQWTIDLNYTSTSVIIYFDAKDDTKNNI